MHLAMSRRVRLYAEAIEQAYHYILPAIEETLPEVEIEIVYAPSRLKSNHENQTLQALYQATTPDGLISIIDNDVETPLAVIAKGPLMATLYVQSGDSRQESV